MAPQVYRETTIIYRPTWNNKLGLSDEVKSFAPKIVTDAKQKSFDTL